MQHDVHVHTVDWSLYQQWTEVWTTPVEWTNCPTPPQLTSYSMVMTQYLYPPPKHKDTPHCFNYPLKSVTVRLVATLPKISFWITDDNPLHCMLTCPTWLDSCGLVFNDIHNPKFHSGSVILQFLVRGMVCSVVYVIGLWISLRLNHNQLALLGSI